MDANGLNNSNDARCWARCEGNGEGRIDRGILLSIESFPEQRFTQRAVSDVVVFSFRYWRIAVAANGVCGTQFGSEFTGPLSVII